MCDAADASSDLEKEEEIEGYKMENKRNGILFDSNLISIHNQNHIYRLRILNDF